ncbi:uncharacterized protein LOC119366774 [Triticum dicoccoides]|uniref:uncharacterized protein LOC119366774 n=1 Tax=Triticum dicoccoides TaxID=85692 RepID=UPI00188EE8DF|nr:uncharacterized protein LOC119366774 [Triticum dicoccoides]
MDKQTIRIAALALLSLHLLCSATIAQCRIVAAGMDNDDIHEMSVGCQKKCSYAYHCCICCINTDWCYTSSERCDRNCPDLFSHSDETVLTRSAVRTDGLMRGIIPQEFGNCRV